MDSDDRDADCALCRHPIDGPVLHESELWLTLVNRNQNVLNYSFLMNLDRHIHLHVIPRYVGTRELAGATFSDPDYPDKYRPTPGDQLASETVIAAVADALGNVRPSPTTQDRGQTSV